MTQPHTHDWINEATGQRDSPIGQNYYRHAPYYRELGVHRFRCRTCNQTCQMVMSQHVAGDPQREPSDAAE